MKRTVTVYYRTRKFKEYGKLSHKNLDDLRSGERSLLVSGADEKEDPSGFCSLETEKRRRAIHGNPHGVTDVRGGISECSEMSKKVSWRADRYSCRWRGSCIPTS